MRFCDCGEWVQSVSKLSNARSTLGWITRERCRRIVDRMTPSARLSRGPSHVIRAKTTFLSRQHSVLSTGEDETMHVMLDAGYIDALWT